MRVARLVFTIVLSTVLGAGWPFEARAAQQPQNAALVGVVTDPTGAPIADTVLSLFGPTRRTARSDGEGRFTIEELTPGEYRLEVARPGFATFSRQIVLNAAQREEVSIALALAEIAEYVETVSKTREEARRTPFLISEVPGEELRRTGAATFEEALAPVAGLQHGTQGNAFTRIATRGLRDTADVLVLVDGVPFRQLNGSADLTMLPVPALQGIEFVKGPASSVYGRSAIGGVMQVFTIPNQTSRPSGEFRVGVSSFDTRELNGYGQWPWEGGRAAAAVAVSRSDGFQDSTGRDANFASLTAEQTFAARFQLRVQYLVSDVDAGRGSIIPLEDGEPMFGISRDVNFGIDDARFEGRLHSATIRNDLDLGRGLILTNALNFNRYDRFSTGGITIVPPPTAATKGWSESSARQDTWIDDLLLRWDAGSAAVRSTLQAGLTIEHGTQDQASPAFGNAPTYRGPDYLNPVTNAQNDPRGIRGATTLSDFEQTIVSAYVQERLEFNRIGGVAGLRWDDFDQSLRRSDTGVTSSDSRSRVSPRLGLDVVAVQRPDTEVVPFVNWVEGFRPQFPALSTQGGVTIPQLLRPEATRSVEGGVKLRYRRLSGQVGIFNMRKIDGQRSFRSGPEDFVFVNATTRVRGFESEGRLRLEGGHAIWAHYSFHDARHIEFRPTPTTNFDGFRLRMAPRHIAGAGAGVSLPLGMWTTSLSFVGSRPLRDNIVNPQMLPSYAVLNSSMSIPVGTLTVVVFGTNLTDTFYIGDDFSSQNAGNAGSPRRVGVQVGYSFQ